MNLKIVEQTSSHLKLHEPSRLEYNPYEKGFWLALLGCLLPLFLIFGGTLFLMGVSMTYSWFRSRSPAENSEKISTNIPTEDVEPWEVLGSGIFLMVVFGLMPSIGFIKLLMFLSSTRFCTFDKFDGKAILENKNLFHTKVSEHLIHEISDIQVEESTREDEYSNYKVYRLVLVLASGKRLPLTSFPDHKNEPNQQLVNDIREFLNLERTI